MTIPETMIAIAIDVPGGPEVLRPVAVPVPPCAGNEVLIRVAAAGVNGPDLAQRSGNYDPPPGASALPGLEVAGEVVATGSDVSGVSVGDRVMALTNGGGYAEYVAVPFGQVLQLPRGWSFAEAAALRETWFTVTQTLVMRAGLAEGMYVLAHGAAGGIGGATIQISALLGARAIGVTSSPEKAAYALELGAYAVIDTSREDLAARVMALTGNLGADRIVDLVGGEMTAINVDVSARNGHIVQVSTLGGSAARVPLRTIMAKGLTLSGSTLRPQTAATKAAIAGCIRSELLPRLTEGRLPGPRLTTFPLAEAHAAHRHMQSRTHIGKLVLLTAFRSA